MLGKTFMDSSYTWTSLFHSGFDRPESAVLTPWKVRNEMNLDEGLLSLIFWVSAQEVRLVSGGF